MGKERRKLMKQITTLATAILLAMGLSASPAFAGNAMNPCNPCAAKHKMNPATRVL
jgi:hypothetical protein